MQINFSKTVASVVIYFCITMAALAQNPTLKKFEKDFDNLDFTTRIAELQKLNPKTLSAYDCGNYYHLYAKTFYLENKLDKALTYFIKAREKFDANQNDDKANEISITLAEIKHNLEYPFKDYKYLLEDAIDYAKKTNNIKLLCSAYKQTGNCFFLTDTKKAISYYQLAIAENKKVKDTAFECRVLSNIGLGYSEFLNQQKLARKCYQKILPYYLKKKMSYELAITYMNMAAVLRNEKKPDSAIIYYHKADSVEISKHRGGFKRNLYEEMSDTYKELKDYKRALEYSEKYLVYKNISDNNEIMTAIRDIDAKYQTKENKLQITTLKSNLKKGGMVIVFLLVVLIVFILGYQNLRRKRKIAEQEKLIETQKLENVLQEQELNEIDKLLEGQEKERIKIANDLHDNLGSMLATLKLNFQNLKLRNETIADSDKQLFDKTDALLEEAYQKIRTIAHAQNAGVIGNDGLVPAIYNIAAKIAIPGKLSIQVIPFGLNGRLENILELAIFRMIQELLTNAVKHADATEIIISLTQHQDSLNIIIEDNGKGFNPSNINKKESMGLPNIEKKTEQLGGNFTIDSAPGRGTTIIIDLPL